MRGSQYAPPVDLDRLPKYVPEAFIAIEDRWYYYHFGFNPWGIVRSQLYNLKRESAPCAAARPSPSSWPATSSLTLNQNYRRKAQELIRRLAGGAIPKKQIRALPQPHELAGYVASKPPRNAISARARPS